MNSKASQSKQTNEQPQVMSGQKANADPGHVEAIEELVNVLQVLKGNVQLLLVVVQLGRVHVAFFQKPTTLLKFQSAGSMFS